METSQAKRLYYLIGILAPSVADAFLLGFYTIYLLHYLTLAEIAIQYAFWMLVLALADFPTGSLADVWGAKKCIMLSYGLMMGGYLGLLAIGSLVTLLLPLFFAIHFLFAFSAAQESGTLTAWFTNHWKANNEDMTEIREIYGKTSAYSLLAATGASILGGCLGAYLRIEFVFIAAILYCLAGAAIATRLDRPEIVRKDSGNSYFGHTKNSLAVLS